MRLEDSMTKQQLALIRRYYADAAYRDAMPCSECGKVGGCKHFPKAKS